MEPDFNFGDSVAIGRSGEVGTIQGVAHYAELPTQYFVEYTDSNGCAAEGWFRPSHLVAQ